MRVKVFDRQGLPRGIYFVWDKAFDQWLDRIAETFFERGGYAELWDDRKGYYLHARVEGKSELERHIRVLTTVAWLGRILAV